MLYPPIKKRRKRKVSQAMLPLYLFKGLINHADMHKKNPYFFMPTSQTNRNEITKNNLFRIQKKRKKKT